MQRITVFFSVLLLLGSLACKKHASCKVHVRFPEIQGLTQSAAVKSNDERIGTIRKIAQVQGAYVVCIDLDGDKQIPKGSGFQLRSDEIFGAQYIDIVMNPASGEYLASQDTVAGIIPPLGAE